MRNGQTDKRGNPNTDESPRGGVFNFFIRLSLSYGINIFKLYFPENIIGKYF